MPGWTRRADWLHKELRLSRLTGPIFDKELRVSARRRRNYVLRIVYLGLLTGFIALVWAGFGMSYAMRSPTSLVLRMAEAGKFIIVYVIWFQFCAAQLLAVIMLSSSISDELDRRTLGLLMTTPINGLQIVLGKLCSSLLQLMILLAISLPLLAIVRVFGGVPGRYVLVGLAVTLTAMIFAGALSLFLSIYSRRSYEVIIKTLFILGVLYAFLPMLVGLWLPQWLWDEFFLVLSSFNPFLIMYHETLVTRMTPVPNWLLLVRWPIHSAILLAGSALLVGASARIVRNAGLRQACGELDPHRPDKTPPTRNRFLQTFAREKSEDVVGRIKGSTVVWKELKTPLLHGGRQSAVIGSFAGIIALLGTYGVCALQKSLDETYTQAWYVAVFVVLGSVCTSVLASTCITSEKESQTWPLLLGTTLSDWQILFGKARAVFWRCLPIWLFLVGHVLLFTAARYIHPVVSVHLALLAGWLILFLTAAGIYFSARFKRTATAVLAGLAMGMILWVVIPVALQLAGTIKPMRNITGLFFKANPAVQMEVIMFAGGGVRYARRPLEQLVYQWPFYEQVQAGSFTRMLLTTSLAYAAGAGLFAWRAKRRFRRNLF